MPRKPAISVLPFDSTGLGLALTWNLLLLCGFPDCYIAIHLDILDLYRRSSLIDILEAHYYIVITEE